MTDQDLVLSAMEEAQIILAEYVDPGRLRSADFTINRLLLVLDHHRRQAGSVLRAAFEQVPRPRKVCGEMFRRSTEGAS